MKCLLSPKDLSRDFLALAASKSLSLFQNLAEGTGKYKELENTCIIPSFKTFLAFWQMKGRPGACLQEDLGFSSWAFSCIKPCSKYVGSAYRAVLLGAIHWELLFPIIQMFWGQKKESAAVVVTHKSLVLPCTSLSHVKLCSSMKTECTMAQVVATMSMCLPWYLCSF